jgi:hypothetical protein
LLVGSAIAVMAAQTAKKSGVNPSIPRVGIDRKSGNSGKQAILFN